MAYPRVRTILFDEIFPDNMRYLGGEVTALEEFYNTVDRWHDRVRLIMCSNAVSLANPYFAAFNINVTPQIENKTQYQRYCDSFIVVELADYGGFPPKSPKAGSANSLASSTQITPHTQSITRFATTATHS